MGMFDYITCKLTAMPADLREAVFQTKSLDCMLENYEIREDGMLWREHYDTEDRSDRTKPGLAGLVGMMARVNKRWEKEPHTGAVEFCASADKGKTWFEFVAVFRGGKMTHFEQLRPEGL